MAEYNFIESDPDKIYNEVIGNLIESCNEPLYPGDERRIYGEAVVSLFVTLYNLFNDRARQRLLRYARGNVLDGLGELLGVVRLPASAAHATFRFTTSVVRPEDILIPQGTRLTTDGSIYFATEDAVAIKAGDTFVDVNAVATEGGERYNGYTVGSIETLVDLIPYIDTVENTTVTTGGDDGEPYNEDGDNRLRERIRLAPSQLTTAGPEASYVYYAMSADADIIDVAVDSPSECVVNIYPLLKGGKLPDEETLKAVADTCSARDVRPMTDKVQALAPQTVEYGINIHYYCRVEDEAATVEAIEGADGAIAQFNQWQQSMLGCDINPDYLRKLVLVPGDNRIGADRVDVTAPVFTPVGTNAVARLSGPITVTHEVIA